MKKPLLITVIAVLTAAVSCVETRREIGRQAIPYVSNILSDIVPGRALLQNASDTGREGKIYVYGDSVICACVCDSLMSMDRFDNASGASRPDQLPDFAGETIVTFADSIGIGFNDFLSEKDTAGLRRQAVNILLAALDTTCCLSRFDNVGLGRKTPAKQLVLLDPGFALFGKYDIDTLLQASSCDVQVIVPIECTFRKVVGDAGKIPGIAVMTACDRSVSPRYQAVFSKVCREMRNSVPDSCNVFCDTVSTLRTFLDSYLLAGHSEPLDAVVVDCCDADIHELYKEYVRMTDVRCEDFSIYGQLFSAGFHFVSALRCATDRCYADIRSRNLFTHRIYAPGSENYYCTGGIEDNSSIRVIECSR